MVKISELTAKDVVCISDGRRLGSIGDLDIDLETGLIQSIIIPAPSRLFGMMSGGQDLVIPWSQIVKIGSDVVLVDLNPKFVKGADSNYVPPSYSGSSGGF
ncbi:MAG: sporulation protein YlmC/YmxH family [Bacilli bacterium]|nr:sporulation protein YlmC/YmxH family [Bacilli bacterium]